MLCVARIFFENVKRFFLFFFFCKVVNLSSTHKNNMYSQCRSLIVDRRPAQCNLLCVCLFSQIEINWPSGNVYFLKWSISIDLNWIMLRSSDVCLVAWDLVHDFFFFFAKWWRRRQWQSQCNFSFKHAYFSVIFSSSSSSSHSLHSTKLLTK